MVCHIRMCRSTIYAKILVCIRILINREILKTQNIVEVRHRKWATLLVKVQFGIMNRLKKNRYIATSWFWNWKCYSWRTMTGIKEASNRWRETKNECFSWLGQPISILMRLSSLYFIIIIFCQFFFIYSIWMFYDDRWSLAAS